MSEATRERSSTARGERAILSPQGSRHSASPEDAPQDTTDVLRQCTALAARARTDLLGQRHHAAAQELEQLLGQVLSWEAEARADLDPTMTALAAAALQDLAEQLPHAAVEGAARLCAAIGAALELLHDAMGVRSLTTTA